MKPKISHVMALRRHRFDALHALLTGQGTAMVRRVPTTRRVEEKEARQ